MIRPRQDRLRTTLIVLSSVAVALGVITYFVVFFPTGAYQPVVIQGPSTTPLGIASTTISSSTTASGTIGLTPTPSSTAAATTPGEFTSSYSYPYPVTWSDGGANFSITGASLVQNELTVTLAIQMGNAGNCVLSNLRLVADEAGTMRPPDSPSGAAYTFPDTQSCNGTPGATYSEPVVFNVDGANSPFLLTTGGTSNMFFQAATTTTGGVDITLPANSG